MLRQWLSFSGPRFPWGLEPVNPPPSQLSAVRTLSTNEFLQLVLNKSKQMYSNSRASHRLLLCSLMCVEISKFCIHWIKSKFWPIKCMWVPHLEWKFGRSSSIVRRIAGPPCRALDFEQALGTAEVWPRSRGRDGGQSLLSFSGATSCHWSVLPVGEGCEHI